MLAYNVIPMLRKTLTILSLIGLLLSVGLWGVSYLNIYYTVKLSGMNIYAQTILVLHCGAITWPLPRPAEPPNSTRRWESAGFAGLKTFWSPVYNSTWTWIRIPFWMPTALFCFLSCFSYAPFRRRRKRKKLGLCLKCGYNLRGLTEPRCPECSTPFDERLLKKDV